MTSAKQSRAANGWFAGDPEARLDRRQPARRVRLVNPVLGEITDISRSGFGVESHKPLPVLLHDRFTLRRGGSRVRVEGEVRWCQLTGTSLLANGDVEPVYRAGIALLRDAGFSSDQ